MASSSLLPHSLLPLPTASSLFTKSSLSISSVTFALSQISVSRTGSVPLQPLVGRFRKSSFGIARAGESGEEAPPETGDDESAIETGGEEESAVAVAVKEKAPKKPSVKLNEIIGVKSRVFH